MPATIYLGLDKPTHVVFGFACSVAPVIFFLNSSSNCCGFRSLAEGESVLYMRNGEAHPAIVMKVGKTILKICKRGVGMF